MNLKSTAVPRKKHMVSSFSAFFSDAGTPIPIRHSVFEVPSQWTVGKNVTKKANILHRNFNRLCLPAADGIIEFLTVADHRMHSYILLGLFKRACSESSVVCFMWRDSTKAILAISGEDCSWRAIRYTIDKIHKQVCGHSCYSDMNLLFIENKF